MNRPDRYVESKQNGHCTRHHLNTADAVTFLRIVGTLLLAFLRPLSRGFFRVYALTGLTDVLDGWIARKTKTASDFGARLDSIADLLLYAVMLLRVFPVLWNTLPMDIWYAVAVILILRLSAYGIAAVKYRQFASLHTYLNKVTGGAVFLIPFLLVTEYVACLEARERCPYWREKAPIQQDLLGADLLIFTSPNYCMMPSAPMKAFLDLFFTNWMSHKPLREMFSKRAVVISTAAGAGAKNTVKLIGNNLENWGIPEIHPYAAVVNAMNWEMVPPKKKARIDKDMDKLARKLYRSGRVSVGVRTRILFWFYGSMQKADWGASPAEKQYWEENGWLSGGKPWKAR